MGIGAATVRRLSAEGYHVTALDACLADDHQTLDGVDYPLATRADLESVAVYAPDRITAVVCDVRDRAALGAVVQELVHDYGRVDVVVAAAGVIAGGQPQWQTPEATLRTLIDIDLTGVWNAAATAVPFMLQNPTPKGCRFVAVASAAAERGLLHLTGYCAAKHAVVGLVRGLAVDLQVTGVTAVAVAPGSTRTPMLEATADLYALNDASELGAHQLLRRNLTAEEVSATIAFCCSLEAAALNGSVVAATGGFVG